MLNKEKTQIRVGIFVMAGIVLAMYVIFMIGGEKQLFEPRFTLKAKFQDISGLRNGAPIQLAGLKVGFVDKIFFSPDLAQKDVELTFKINRKFQHRIRKDSVSTINTQGLLGDKYIYISVGSEEQPMLNDGDYIDSKEAMSIYSFAEKSGQILEDVKEASKYMRKFFEDMMSSKDDLRATFKSLKNVMNEAEKGDGVVHALFYDPKGKQIIGDISSSMAALKDIMVRADASDKKSGEVSGIIKNLKDSSKDLKDVMGKINRGEGTIGGLISDPALYNDIRSLFGRANRNKLLKAVIRSTLAENDTTR